MADASCSGGTPFKRLIDHQTRDVSHHQDRLVNHAGHGQGSFRSAPAHPAQGHQDGFGTFIGGNSGLPGLQHDPASRLAVHAAALQPSHARGFPAAAPTSQQELSHHARVSPVPDVSNWAADFGRFSTAQRPVQGGAAARAAPSALMNQAPMQLNFQAAFGQPNAAFAPMYGTANGAFMNPDAMATQRQTGEADFDQEISQWMASHGSGNMDQVDAAMDQMARELELNEAALAGNEAATLGEGSTLTDLETPEIGNLSLESREMAPATQQEQVEADGIKARSAVSEAAEKLLESVQHEAGEKWQNSVFLSLMRDFRDGKKDIVDDEIRQTGDEPDVTQPQT